jgi:hypothetical protein
LATKSFFLSRAKPYIIVVTLTDMEVSMDARKRFNAIRKKEIQVKTNIISAEKSIKKLDATPVQNPSLLIKYRGNLTVPAVWIPQQGVRLQDLPYIPAEKIANLNTYIIDNTKNIDGGDLDVY